MHGLDTADPCEQRPQSRILEFGHHFCVSDRRGALQRCRVLQEIGFALQLRWRIHCRILFPRFRGTRPPTKSFDGFADRLRMRAVVCLEPLGDRGRFRREESGSQSGIVSRDGEVLALQPLIEKVYVLRFVYDRLLLHWLHSASPFVGRYQQRPFNMHFLFIVRSRNSRINDPIRSSSSSNAKWPVSRRWSSAPGISLLKSSAPSTVKIPSFLPQVISMGGCCLRKYSCQSA